MIYKFKKKSNPDDNVFLDARTKAEAHQKLRTMVDRASEYEEVTNGVSKRKNNSGQK